ncbi:EF-P lysine aminoacylase GenX [Proteobacteria bacterium 005FR1]|nr:EF-P lysine aminoacylase GenX [Proteobacteria bacterium 005FR1]
MTAATEWQPSATPSMLRARADLYQRIRAFFAARHYLEIEAPLLGSGGTTDPAIESFRTSLNGREYYLQTSPEFFMKRLLAAGSGSIFSIGKVFRSEEQGRHHNPEFTMLEWYRPGFDDRRMMKEVGELLQQVLGAEVESKSYRALFVEQLGLDPHQAPVDELRNCASRHIDFGLEEENRDLWLDLLFSHLLQPTLHDRITLVYDYPASQAALAKVMRNDSGQPVARRFEAFYRGMELANGYWELTDAAEQARRFARDNDYRREAGLPAVHPDTALVEALASGMPDCAGVALGLDRLLMLLTGATQLADVLPFAWSRI